MMRLNGLVILASCLGSLPAVRGQFHNWQVSQINTSICLWLQPRAALVRDTVYLDGGSIWWSPGMADGQIGKPVNNANFQGYILSYNLSEPFSKETNVTGLMLKNLLSKARGGVASGISTEPNYYDGGMLANDAEFFLYGGAVFRQDLLYDAPTADAVLGYRQYAYGPEKPLWQKGFSGGHLDDGVTRYVAYGAAVNAPSENKAWYFSGLASPTRGPIIHNSGNDSTRAVNISNTLIGLDMEKQLEEKWTNATLPEKVKGRSNAEVVWVPVGKQGILVVLGGVVYPEWASASHKSSNETASKLQSQDFMRVIDIYDVASKEWYQQPTQGGPGTKTRGCAVVAPASDYSSFNIYYYGGYDGISPANEFSDEVWVLSLPSFTWTLINKGKPAHARSGHKCFMPYPDQMMVFGGYTTQSGTYFTCLDQGPIVLFNLTSGQWIESYSPSRFANYGVHDSIVNAIGGDASGGATLKSPVPSGWSTSALGDIFSTPYDKKKITQYWPYENTPPGPTASPEAIGSSDGSPSLQILLPAITVPVVAVIILTFALWYFRNRKMRRAPYSTSSSTAVDSSRNVLMWLRGHRVSKQLTLTESHTTSPAPHRNMEDLSETTDGVFPDKGAVVRHEMEDTQVSELCGQSSPAELHDTGFVPVSPLARSHLGYFSSEVSNDSNKSEKGPPASDSVSLGSPGPYNLFSDRHWADSPMAEPFSNLSATVETTHCGGSADIQDFEHAEHEEANMNSPVSPSIASERCYADVMSPSSMVNPLQRTKSEKESFPFKNVR